METISECQHRDIKPMLYIPKLVCEGNLLVLILSACKRTIQVFDYRKGSNPFH